MEIKFCPVCLQGMITIKWGGLRLFKCPYCKVIFHISMEYQEDSPLMPSLVGSKNEQN